jgi:hypothetical protein
VVVATLGKALGIEPAGLVLAVPGALVLVVVL